MQRSHAAEIMDGEVLDARLVERVHRDLSRTHRLLGNHAEILRRLRQPDVRSVLDIGCGHGRLLEIIRRRTGAEVIGVDLRPPPNGGGGDISILKLDAVRDRLPQADVAVSVCLMHHLTGDEFVELVQNVGRTSRRFVILDLVRHRVPLALFRVAAPLMGLSRVNVLDGQQSIRRAFLPAEFRDLIQRALKGVYPEASFSHTVAPFWTRQIADIRYAAGNGTPS